MDIELYQKTYDDVSFWLSLDTDLDYSYVESFRNGIIEYESKDDLTALLSAVHDLVQFNSMNRFMAENKSEKGKFKFRYEMASIFYETVVNQIKISNL